MIAELMVVHKVPLSAGVLVAPSVALAWEVNPLWVAELIAHEVQVAAVDG